jgi:HlyD family secretion protein
VDEADIGRLRDDTPVTFTVDAFAGQTFTGYVAQIRKAPQVVQNVVTYTVVVAVENPGGRLLPGMTANVRFVTAKRDDALKVPNTALRFRPPTASATGDGSAAPGPARAPEPGRPAPLPTNARVWVQGRNGEPVRVPVVLGVTDGTATEIVEGNLAVGQQVLIGVEEASSGTPATPSPVPRLRF